MESKAISDLARLLRRDGDKVLNEKCRLTLSAQILHDLNEAFSLIAERDVYNTTFQVIPSNNMKAEIFLDLQFLHDFVQKTVCLSVIEDKNLNNTNHNVDISKFRNLRSLEVHKIPILTVRGVQSLRAQLQSITCIRCVDNIKDILSACGADHSTGFVWSELKEAKFCYNNLQSIDSSLEYLPWLQVLDLSHNRIITAEALKWLPNLKYINLSYNKLEEIPMFHVDSSRKLQILKISNNDIEALTGVNRLEALCELDLANNYILDHSALIPISYLPNLRWLTLLGNPLSFHPDHRKFTSKYLHKNAGTFKFCLDQLKLSKVENSLTGSYKITQRLQRSPRRHLNSVSSTQSYETSASDSTCSEYKITEANINERLKPIKPVKVRNALIVDIDDDYNTSNDDNQTDRSNTNSLQESMTSNTESIEDTTHLETKRQLSDLRSQFGDAWLHSQGGSLVQHVLGMTSLVGNTVSYNEASSKSKGGNEASTYHEKNSKAFQVPLLSSTPKNEYNSSVSPKNNTLYKSVAEETSCEDFISDAKTDSDDNMNQSSSEAQNSCYDSVISDDNFYTNDNNATGDDNDSDNGSEEHTYLARIDDSTGNHTEVFVVVTEKFIKECSILSGKTITKWSLSTLLSCERTNSNLLTICFDTIRRARNQRKYFLEHQEDAQKLDSHLREILSERPLQEMNQIVLRCMKCSMQFTKEIKQITVSRLPNEKSESTPCPSCHSKLVVEIEDDSAIHSRESGLKYDKSNQIQKDNLNQDTGQEQTQLQHSKSQSSIGSANSLEDSITDSTVSIAGSDIEVLSNPSQSSIEVLHRKRSSEERRLMAYPSLDTIHDVIQSNNASKLKAKSQSLATNTLTESSSSGSMTNSVCTAIENDKKSETHTPNNGMMSDFKNGKANLSSSPSIISSMLEGLFQSANNLIMKKTDDSKNLLGESQGDDAHEQSFSYSYHDFSIVDHRLTLHLYQNVFTDVNEVLKWLVRCEIVMQGSEKNDLIKIESCVVLTNTRLHVLKIVGKERGDTTKWLQKYQSYQVHRLCSLNILPYKQGLSITIEQVKPNSNLNILCLLKDVQRTNNLLVYLSENKISDTCQMNCVVSPILSTKLQKVLSEEKPSSQNSSPILSTNQNLKKHNVQLFMIFSSFEEENKSRNSSGCLLVTCDYIIISQDMSWMFSDLDNEFVVSKKHPMMNLVEIDVQDRYVIFHFLDEMKNSSMETWKIKLETRNSIEILISAIKQPWEKLFLVPLTVNI